MLRHLTACCGRRRIRLSRTDQSYPPENSLLARDTTQPEMSDQRVKEIALFVTDIMMSSTKPRDDLKKQVNDIVHEEGWWREALATRILTLAVKVVEAGAPLGATMTAAYHRAVDEAAKILELAEDFAHEHPILTTVACVVIALGILYLLCPWVIEVLGFTELGPLAGEQMLASTHFRITLLMVLGSWAARWQVMYGGRVPVRSVFSYLQRLGMTWRGGVVVVSKL